MSNPGARTATVGLRARTGRAVAVVLTGSRGAPEAVERAELTLTTGRVPSTRQPYHDVMHLPWDEAEVAVRKASSAIEVLAEKELDALVRRLAARGLTLCAVGVVGAPIRDLRKIGSVHIRAHAAEGVLFRSVLELAAQARGLPTRLLPEKGLDALAAPELRVSMDAVADRLADLGRVLGRPWRADEKAAATAAWLSLSG